MLYSYMLMLYLLTCSGHINFHDTHAIAPYQSKFLGQLNFIFLRAYLKREEVLSGSEYVLIAAYHAVYQLYRTLRTLKRLCTR